MKKIILLASALTLGTGIAYAQDATMQPPTSGAATPDASTPPATPDASMPAATPDASTPATTPDATAPTAGTPSTTPTAGPTDLPTCSKTVTDNCKQGGSSSSHHKATHRRHK